MDDVVKLNYSAKKETPVTPKQIVFLSSVIHKHKIQIDYDISKLSKNEASRKIDKILSTYGR